MKSTIDKAGRVVIPAEIRERAALRPGTEIEITHDDLGVRIVRAVPGPRLVRRGELLIAEPTAPAEQRTPVDVAALIERERDRWPW